MLGVLTEKKQKNKKKKKQKVVLKQKKEESQKFLEMLKILEELEKEGKNVDVQFCPHCKSPRIRRIRSLEGDMSGHMGMLPEKFECLDCGWRGRLVVKATNKKLSIKEVAIIAEAANIKE